MVLIDFLQIFYEGSDEAEDKASEHLSLGRTWMFLPQGGSLGHDEDISVSKR